MLKSVFQMARNAKKILITKKFRPLIIFIISHKTLINNKKHNLIKFQK